MKALILVDLQNDFCPGGALQVNEGDKIIPLINDLQEEFDLVIATQDWHPNDHMSFASNHPGKRAGESVDLEGLQQVLWPDHCVQGSKGAEFVPLLNREKIERVFQKGTDKWIDSYSAFYKPEQMSALKGRRAGAFEGIGAEIRLVYDAAQLSYMQTGLAEFGDLDDIARMAPATVVSAVVRGGPARKPSRGPFIRRCKQRAFRRSPGVRAGRLTVALVLHRTGTDYLPLTRETRACP